MGTYDVRDWLETLGICAECYSGRIDDEKEKVLCVFDDRMDKNDASDCFGGSKIHEFKVAILFQWNKDPEETERAAQDFISKLKREYREGGFYIGDYFVNFLRIYNNSEDCDRNGHGLCQRLIYFDIIYTD